MPLSRPVAFAAICACAMGAGLHDAQANPTYSDDISRFTFGLYCAPEPNEELVAPDTAAGVVNLIETPEFFAASTIVPAELGVGFGIMAQAAPGVLADPLHITITHPPYPNSGIAVERWQTDIDDATEGLVGFSFEHDYELVIGDWTIQGVFKDEVLFDITFTVVPPNLAPDLVGRCTGQFMS